MKKLQILYVAFILSIGCAGQNIPSNAKDILISKTWIIDDLTDHTTKLVFTNTKMLTYTGDTLVGEDEYYFVDSLDQCGPGKFMESKVGSSNTGKFIVYKDFCLELITLSNSKLEFKNLKLNSNMSATPE